MLRSKDKEKFLQNSKILKDTDIFIYKDFCKATTEIRKSPWEEALEHCRQNKIPYFNYSRIGIQDLRKFYRLDVFFFLILQGTK